jgi:hypothetical protein
MGHLDLRLVQFFSELSKFFAFQKNASRNTLMINKQPTHSILLCSTSVNKEVSAKLDPGFILMHGLLSPLKSPNSMVDLSGLISPLG